jgi:hypothetical protein
MLRTRPVGLHSWLINGYQWSWEKVSIVRRYSDSFLTFHYTVDQTAVSVSTCDIAIVHFPMTARHSEVVG